MTINKEKLIELLVEKTGLEKGKVEEQLLQLIGRIRQEVDQGKSFQIEAFGTFSIKDNALNFKPADTLETEINHKYAGMKPIELIGAFKEAPPGEKEKPEEETESQPQEAHSQEERLVETILGIKETPEPSVVLNEHVTDEAEESGDKEKTKASFVFDTEGTKEEKHKPEKAEPAAVPAPRKDGKEKKDTIGTVLTVCVIILAVGVTGWLVYDLGFFSTAPETNTQAEGQRQQAIQATSGQSDDLSAENAPDPSSAPSNTEELANVEEPDTPEPQPVSSIQDNEDNGAETETSVYGLMGTINPEGNDGYTIVVHSIRRLNRAQTIRNNLETEGYRTIFVSAVVNGTTYWRIGVGQFETIAGAQKATETLPEPFKSNHFIKRIQ